MPAQLNDAMQQQLLDELFETWIQKQVQTRLQSSSQVMETVAA
jgi:hypothetical protein